MDELKERLRMSEIRADQFQKETEVLQSRLEDALQEQVKLEDRLHEEEERIESLENEKRDAARQMREMGAIYEAERTSMTKEKEEMGNREEEMQAIIQRLKESLSQKANGDDDARSEGRGFRHCMLPLTFFKSHKLTPTQLIIHRRASKAIIILLLHRP